MLPLPAESLTAAAELVCYVFTALGVLATYLFAIR